MTLCEKQAEDGRDGFQLLEGAMLTYNENKGKSKKIKRRTVAQKSKGMSEVFGNEENGGKGTEDGKNDGGDDGQEEEEIQRLRRVHRIFTWGLNIPRPISDFASVPLPDKLRANLRDFNQPTPVQMQGIPIGLLHRDHLITAPTGSGKTLSFAIPLIVRALDNRKKRSVTIGQCADDIHSLCAVVIEPTKILAKQTYENFLKFCDGLDINCEYLREEGIGEKCDILVTTPNRFIFALEKLSKDGQKKTKIVEGLQWLILDECDRMFDRTEGEASFRVQLSKILSLCNGNETRCGFYSATFSYEVEEWCKENFQEVAMICIGPRNSANELVKQELLFVGWEQAKVSAVRDIVRGGFDPPALLFLQSKDRAKQLFVELSESCNAIPVGLISGELTEEECELVVERFRSGKIWLLICTELMGRGIDFQEVNMVINFDLPTSIVSYIHRIGRTGRAGRIGRAITLFTESDLPIIRPIATVIRQAGFTVPEYLLRLNKPSKKSQKKLKRMAPKRKNLLPNWNKLKRKVSIGVKESKIKKLNERRRKKQRRHSENGKGRERKTDIEKADANRMQSLSNIEQGTKEETKTHNSRGGRNGRHERNKPKRERGDGH